MRLLSFNIKALVCKFGVRSINGLSSTDLDSVEPLQAIRTRRNIPRHGKQNGNNQPL